MIVSIIWVQIKFIRFYIIRAERYEKKMLKRLLERNHLSEMLRFIVTGGLCFLIDYGTMVLLKDRLGINYLIASATGFVLSVILNYIMCVAWVFSGAGKRSARTVIVFAVSSLIGLAFHSFLMWLFVTVFDIFYKPAKVIVTALVMVWNYIAKKKAVNL